MKVKELMTKDVLTCHEDSNVCKIAEAMWRRDCGVLPVVNKNNEVIGVITDRDMCIATACRNCEPANLTAREVMTRNLFTCSPDDDVSVALKTMREKQVRRLPVLDERGNLCGILSLNDVAIKAWEAAMPTELSSDDLAHTLEAICRHRSLAQQEPAARAAA